MEASITAKERERDKQKFLRDRTRARARGMSVRWTGQRVVDFGGSVLAFRGNVRITRKIKIEIPMRVRLSLSFRLSFFLYFILFFFFLMGEEYSMFLRGMRIREINDLRKNFILFSIFAVYSFFLVRFLSAFIAYKSQSFKIHLPYQSSR